MRVIVTNNETGESKAYLIPYGSRIKIQDGVMLEAGDELTEGSVNPHDILKIKGLRAVQDYMIQEVQRVYRLQGVDINDKHIEVIVRQMLKKVRIEEKRRYRITFREQWLMSSNLKKINRELVEEGNRAGYRRADHAWYYQGFSCDRFLPLRRIFPGDNESSYRGGNQRKSRSAGWSERKRYHR